MTIRERNMEMSVFLTFPGEGIVELDAGDVSKNVDESRHDGINRVGYMVFRKVDDKFSEGNIAMQARSGLDRVNNNVTNEVN